MFDLYNQDKPELTEEEIKLKDKILETVEEYLYADIRYTDSEVAKKLYKIVGDQYDI